MQRSFALSADARSMNETSIPFNSLEFPTDIVLLAVVWRLRYKLSLRDIAEMFVARGLRVHT
jgi:transposase-like protein